MATVNLRSVCKSFGKFPVIHGVDIDIGDGEFVVLVGPSGCGKSTLLRMIAGLEAITSGAILIEGEDVSDLPPKHRDIAMVFQSYALYPHMTVAGNMGFALRLAHVPTPEANQRIERAARILGLENLLDRYPRQLSGGQRQRVAMGRAIVRDPAVFLFDEPLSNLDASLRMQMRVELAQLHQRLGTTMIYVTHDQTEAMTLASKIVVLNRGRVEQIASPTVLYNRPDNLFVARFIGAPPMNVLPARTVSVSAGNSAATVVVALSDGASVSLMCDGTLPAVGQEIQLGVRPEALLPQADGAIAGTVQLVEPLGGLTLVHVAPSGGEPLIVQTAGGFQAAVGETIRLHPEPVGVHLFDADGIRIASGLALEPSLSGR